MTVSRGRGPIVTGFDVLGTMLLFKAINYKREMIMKKIHSLVLAAIAVVASAVAYADEGRIAVTAPINISAPGSYILQNDIAGAFTTVYIEASNVKLDLNGFTVGHTGANMGDGISILGNVKNIEITNGTVSGATRHGIFVPGKSATARNIRIHNVRLSDNAITAISLEGNPGYIVENCNISGGAIGIYSFGGGLILNNVISNTTSGGLVAYSNKVGYRSNVFFSNAPDVSGSGTNLGDNLCSGVICP
jgi:hypothetical protein